MTFFSNIGFEKIKDPEILNTFNCYSYKEINKREMNRKEMGMYILSNDMGSFSWDIEDLKLTQKAGCKTAAYLSAWRKK